MLYAAVCPMRKLCYVVYINTRSGGVGIQCNGEVCTRDKEGLQIL